ncbi:hypothetical protein E2C01_047496 [Portunus trituberculatus]|uniref:Uncharacterized protein n=1 Tax=Portunus trituberculatus TaxID=210409 RepID=A0A5B7G832_PORTR|nr:hypothetical protein [Portunus trituberculatus]
MKGPRPVIRGPTGSCITGPVIGVCSDLFPLFITSRRRKAPSLTTTRHQPLHTLSLPLTVPTPLPGHANA